MSNYIPLQLKTHYSLLRGYCKSEYLVPRLKELSIPACAITDYGTVSGCMNFYKECSKEKINPILGCTLYICERPSTEKTKENRQYSYLTLLCKNLAAWKELIKIVSFSNHPDRHDDKPRLTLDELATFNLSNFICLTGGRNSTLANSIVTNRLEFYNNTCKDCIYSDWKNKASDHYIQLRRLFGRNLYIEVSLDNPSDEAANTISKCWRELYQDSVLANTEELGEWPLQLVAAPNIHYQNKEDAIDHRVLVCIAHHLTLSDVTSKISDKDEYLWGTFFCSEEYYLRETLSNYTEEELANTIKITEQCETYSISRPQELPHFSCPNGLNENEYIRELCREGWRKLSHKIPKDKHKEYGDRINFELKFIQEKNFDGYFLIVQDIIQFCESKNWLVGVGRGSAGGSLVSYLLGIVKIDAIKYNLLFERFLSPGRNDLPDIDVDVPKHYKKEILQYIIHKYGIENVYPIITYQNLKGRSALTEVLRVHSGLDYLTIKKITKSIPDEAAISDDLQEMEEKEEDSSSIIRWALENKAEELREWCWLNEEGKLDGPYARKFEQAIRLENTKKARSRHACAVVISKNLFIDYAPLIYDEEANNYMGGFEMKDAEASGLLKMDILGLSTLDRIMQVQRLLYNGF